jgi:glycosyltransferase involved in cell wall biosynthesis
MKEEDKIKSLVYFQSNCFKAYRTLGFHADNTNTLFGIIIEMRNIVKAAEKQDTILLHKFMGTCAEYIANYATINGIDLKRIIRKSHISMTEKTEFTELEDYLEKIKNDLAFVKDMHEEEKEEFIQKCWVCVFPEEYHEDFIKIDRILKSTIEDNKIKYPQLYNISNFPTGGRFGME